MQSKVGFRAHLKRSDIWGFPDRLHLTPFKQLWQHSPDVIERVHGEIYASDAFAAAHEAVQNLPAERDCSLERVVCALMFWSDSTLLANFGAASLWPIYLFFGNESRYTRSTLHSGSCHHIAYIPKARTIFFCSNAYEAHRSAAP